MLSHKSFIGITLFLLFCVSTLAQFSIDSVLKSVPALNKIAKQKDKYHLQIIYTQINRIGEQLNFTDYSYNLSPDNYFYCASLVKLPVSILALKKLNELGFDAEAILFTDSINPCQHKVTRDTSSENKYPSIANYIRRMLLVSDNEAYNRVFEFLGTNYIHENLKTMGFPKLRIINRYELNCEPKNNLNTNPISILDTNLNVIYSQAAKPISKEWLLSVNKAKVGKAYLDWNNQMVEAPKDFSGMNYISLNDVHQILKQLLYKQNTAFGITDQQRWFLEEQMTLLPRQSKWPRYNTDKFQDNYKKYLYYGDFKESINDSNLVSTNCVGQSYGFISDCARIKDGKNDIEFLLSAALYVNEDGILNDGKYEYKSIALPFLAELGRQIYHYELTRKLK